MEKKINPVLEITLNILFILLMLSLYTKDYIQKQYRRLMN
jgi:hypothetical protein